MKNILQTIVSWYFSINPHVMMLYRKLPDNIQTKTIHNNSFSIRYMNNPCLEAQKLALMYDYRLISYIKNPQEPILDFVLECHFPVDVAFLSVKNVPERIQYKLIEQDVNNIRYINNPVESVQVYAIQDCITNIAFMKTPCKKVQEHIVYSGHVWALDIIEPDYLYEEVVLTALDLYPEKAVKILKMCVNPSEKICRKAVENWPRCIVFVENPSEDLALYALDNCWKDYIYEHIMENIKEPSEDFLHQFKKFKIKHGPLKNGY